MTRTLSTVMSLGNKGKKKVSELLVLGKKVGVELTGWNNDLGVFELRCSVERSGRTLEWNFSKAPLEVFHFNRRVSRKMNYITRMNERRCLGLFQRVPEQEEVAEFLKTVFDNSSSILDSARLEEGPNAAATKKEESLDRLLSSFLQLSVSTMSEDYVNESKFPEGYLMKTPMHYHTELKMMNGVVIAQLVVASLAIWLATTYFLDDSIIEGVIILAAATAILWIIGGFYIFLLRPKELDRTEIIPTCFIPGLGQIVVFVVVLYNYFLRRKSRRWVIFRPDYIAYFDSNYSMQSRGVFMIDRNTTIKMPYYNPLMLKISNQDQTLNLHTLSVGETLRWKKAILETCRVETQSQLRLPSFFQVPRDNFGQRSKVPCQWYSDARFLYRDMYDAISNAKHEVYITGWMISPELRLVRDDEDYVDVDTTLETVLGEAVERGVKVHVIIYRDLPVALPNNSKYAKQRLTAKGVEVIRHAARTRTVGMLNHVCCFDAGDIFWSHHEKLVIVDQSLAFVGGIDLAFGRYDDHRHRLFDPEEKVWPGKDFYNVRLKDFEDLEDPHTDLVDRSSEGRMPWHDIHCCVGGNAAKDVSRHFIARWNRELRQTTGYGKMKKKKFRYVFPANYKRTAADALPLPYTARASKLLRSVGAWSLSQSTEASIKTQYLHLISEAESFIYIENQFFNSPDVADAISDRILKAIDDEIEFRVVVILPQWPAFEGMPFDNPQTKVVLEYQHKTIDSIINKVRRHHKIKTEEDVSQYIGFFSLRTADIINGVPKSEQVYVHAKLMIVDDEKCIIGSANLNARSLRGTRDSEVCVYMHAPKLCRNLRIALMAEHLGLHSNSCEGCCICSHEVHTGKEGSFESKLYEKLKYPNDVWAEWDNIAEDNAQIFRQLFAGMQPVDDYITIERARKSLARGPQEEIDIEQKVADLRGNLVRTPLRFLREEVGLLPKLKDFTTFILPTSAFV